MSDSILLERVEANLSRLKLSRIAASLPDAVKAAEANQQSYLSFFDDLLQEEVAAKEQRRLQTAIKTSGLPFIKGIEEFDFGFQPKLDKQQVMSLFDLTFLLEKENVIFLGPPGVGKTHLAVALAMKAAEAGQTIYFTTMADLIKKLKQDHDEGRQARGRSYYKSAVVVVDEVGYTQINREECALFYRFVANRYEKASTIITSKSSIKKVCWPICRCRNWLRCA